MDSSRPSWYYQNSNLAPSELWYQISLAFFCLNTELLGLCEQRYGVRWYLMGFVVIWNTFIYVFFNARALATSQQNGRIDVFLAMPGLTARMGIAFHKFSNLFHQALQLPRCAVVRVFGRSKMRGYLIDCLASSMLSQMTVFRFELGRPEWNVLGSRSWQQTSSCRHCHCILFGIGKCHEYFVKNWTGRTKSLLLSFRVNS